MGGFLLLALCGLCCWFGVAHLRAIPVWAREDADFLAVVAIFVLSIGVLAVAAL